MIVMKNTLLHYVFILMFTLLFPQVDCSAGISEVGPVKPLVNKDENLMELTFREIISGHSESCKVIRTIIYRDSRSRIQLHHPFQ